VEEEMEARRSGEQQQQKQKQKHRSRDKKEAIRTERYRVGNKNGRPREGNEGGSGRPTLPLVPPYCTWLALLLVTLLAALPSVQDQERPNGNPGGELGPCQRHAGRRLVCDPRGKTMEINCS
jgi:hypothetical protein